MKILNIKVTLQDEMLGSSQIYATYIASKAPDADGYEEEVAAMGVDAVREKGMTVFPRDEEGRPCIWDYQIKGFLKDCAGMLNRVSGKGADGKKLPANESSKLKAYKKEIDGLIFPKPRLIPIDTHGAPMGICERPLRAMTMQGERVALASSESVPAGSTFEVQIVFFRDDLEPFILECFDYAEYRGFGQWRNSGKGRATYEVLDHDIC